MYTYIYINKQIAVVRLCVDSRRYIDVFLIESNGDETGVTSSCIFTRVKIWFTASGLKTIFAHGMESCFTQKSKILFWEIFARRGRQRTATTGDEFEIITYLFIIFGQFGSFLSK